MNGRKSMSWVRAILVAVFALVTTTLVATPASAGNTATNVQATFSNEAAPASPPAGWTREVSRDGFIVDRYADCNGGAIKAYGFPANSTYTFDTNGYSNMFQAVFSGSVSISWQWIHAGNEYLDYSWSFQTTIGLWGLIGTETMRQCPPSSWQASPSSPNTNTDNAYTAARQRCANKRPVGKWVAVKKRGKALRVAQKRHSSLYACKRKPRSPIASG